MKAAIEAAIAAAGSARTTEDYRRLREALYVIWDQTPSWGARTFGNAKPELPLSAAMFRATETAHAAWAAAIDGDADLVAARMAEVNADLAIALEHHADFEGMVIEPQRAG